MSTETKEQTEIAQLQQIIVDINEQLEESFGLSADEVERLEAMRDAAIKEIEGLGVQISRNEVFGHLENEAGEKYIAGPSHAEPAIGVDGAAQGEPINLKSEEGQKLKKSRAKAASTASKQQTSTSATPPTQDVKTQSAQVGNAYLATSTPADPAPGYKTTITKDGDVKHETDLTNFKNPLELLFYQMNHGYEPDERTENHLLGVGAMFGWNAGEAKELIDSIQGIGELDWHAVNQIVELLKERRKDQPNEAREAALERLREEIVIKEKFNPSTHEEFDWVHWKMLSCDLELAELKRTYDAAKRAVESRRIDLEFLYGEGLESYCKAYCEENGGKTVKFSKGKCTFTAQNDEWVLDTDKGADLKLKNWMANNQALFAKLKIERYDAYRYEDLNLLKQYAEEKLKETGEVLPGLKKKDANAWASFKVKAT